MNKKVGIVLFCVAGAILIWGIISIVQLILIKHNGSQITATVLKADSDCDKYNKIEVVFENKTYTVNISRNDCKKRVYKVGDSVKLIKHKDYNTLVWHESKFEWLPFMLLAIFTLAYYSNKDKFGKFKKPTPNGGLEQ